MMKGYEKLFVKYLKGVDKLLIPVYQRNYDWKEEQCRQLFNDLEKTIREERKTHFFGSVVSVDDAAGGTSEYLVIDGQQRITTISLLLLAIVNLLKEGALISSDPHLVEKIEKGFLVDEFQPGDKKIRLKPIKGDQKAYYSLWKSREEYDKSSNITTNYLYFYHRIQHSELTIDELYDAVCRLQIIDISLDPTQDDPQLIFESLNSTGLDLNEGDKIRNYILMGLSARQQEQFYDAYWDPIETYTSDNMNNRDVSAFIRDYLSVQQKATPAIRKVYAEFKAYVEGKKDIAPEELLKDLKRYARWYEKLLKAVTDDSRLNACIRRLNRLETTITRPFFLEILRLQNDGELSAADVRNVFETVESYLFRRNICDLPTNALNKIFLSLHNDIMRFDGTSGDYAEKLRFVLYSKKERARFPADPEFVEELTRKDIYRLSGKTKSYLFERLENGDNKDNPRLVYDGLDNGTYTIEHIMPQHLGPAWRYCESFHEEWLHRLANLTLTAYNPNYGNLPFADKRDKKDGYKDSGFLLTQWVAKKDIWGLDELAERSAWLTDRALTLWPIVRTNYQPAETALDEYNLDDEFNFTGETIARFRFQGIEQPASSWVDMYQKILSMLHQTDKTILNRLADSGDDIDLAAHVARTDTAFRNSCMIDERIYVWTNTSTQHKINSLRKFFALYGVDAGELAFYLKESETEAEDEAPRHDLRRRYWEKAMPAVRAATGTFGNVTVTKYNEIFGATGYGGISLRCTANMDCARVELYIGGSSREHNKEIFEYLFKHKPEIEAAYGKALEWMPLKEQDSSRIVDSRDDLKLADESCWEDMIRYHAEGAARLHAAVKGRLDEIAGG